MTEASLNGFPSSQIADKIQEDPYRFLICADQFQTGYDEPLLHTMYVDKVLSSIKAVQTLSRLNRAHPKKHDVFVLDFMNDVDTIQKSFADYYRTTILSDDTDPDKLHDLKAALDDAQVHDPEQIDAFVGLYLDGADRDRLDPIPDACVAVYRESLDEDAQVEFKGKAAKVATDPAYRNAQRNSDKQNARIEHDKALLRVMTAYMKDDTELFKQFVDNESFKRWMADTVFRLTYDQLQESRYGVGWKWPFVAKITRNAGYSGRRWMRLDTPECYSAFCTCSRRPRLSF